MKLKLMATLTVIGFLAGCVTAGGGPSEGTGLQAKALNMNNITTMSGKKEVYIGHFGVKFVTQDKSSSKSSSPMLSSNSNYAQAVLTAKLSGVPQSRFQSITDQAYVSFVKSLEARGYKVNAYSELKSHPRWARVSTLETPYSPNQAAGFLKGEKRQSVGYSPTDMALVDLDAMMSKSELSVIAQETKTPVLSVNYTIHFAYFDKKADYTIDYLKNVPTGGGPSETLSASVGLGQGLQVISGSGIEFLVDQGGTFSHNGHAQLKDPVVVLGAYGSNEDTTSGLAEASNAFSSAVGMLTGKSSEYKEISVTANPSYYEYGVLSVLEEANLRLSNALPAQH